MDFGLLSHKKSGSTELPTNENYCDGSLKKHQRSGFVVEDGLKQPKMAKLGTAEVDLTSTKKCGEGLTSFWRSNVVWPSLSEDGQKMLCFNSTSEPQYSGNGYSTKSIAFGASVGGGLNEAMRGPFSRIKGPFTPSQWMELEHQALIYKHIVANVPVPANLLSPLKRSLYLYGSHGSYPSNFFGCGIPFHVGFSGSNDPEPGRCRRTDGKKWRCSRDAVPDQKYCERHINRGRHRSRKPVEAVGQSNGHPINTITNTSLKVAPVADSSLKLASVISNCGESNGLGVLQTRAPSVGLNSKDISFQGSSHTEFGLVSSDSLLTPLERISYINTTNSNCYWQEGLKYDWTQLSMSIPDFSSSSSSSPAQEKSSSISTLKLYNELDPVHAGHDFLEPVQKSGSWLPMIGGPLGEVLTSTSSNLQLGSSPTGVLQKSMMLGTLSNSNSSGS